MDLTVFTIGNLPVSAGMALTGMAAFTLVVIIGFIVVFLSLRADGRRAAAEAGSAAETLRQSYTSQKESFDKQVEYRDTRITELERRLDEASSSITELRAELASRTERLESEKRQTEQQKQQAAENLKRYEELKAQMTDQFRLIANDVLKTHGETFQKQNREQVDQLLTPLREKIGEFHKNLIEDRASLGAQIRKLQEDGMRMATEAHNLTRALKGSSQTQGAWGEMILTTILERSGLRAGEQYIAQESHGTGDGGRVRTDVEIIMPNDERIVIDSKVSLTAFEALVNAEDETDRTRHLRDHVTSMRGHVKVLASKDYTRHANSGLDFVLMFVPIEAAFSAAITADPELFDYATSQGVVITTPTTLLSALKTVRNVWDTEKRHRNAEEIAERAGQLYEKVVGFATNMDKLGTHLDRAQSSFSDARSQFVDGRGSVIRQVEMLKELGAKTNKQMPNGWQAELEDGAALPLIESAPKAEE